MTSILSSISGRFTGPLVMGTFFPVVIFVILFRVLVVGVIPPEAYVPLIAPLKALDQEWEVLALTFEALILTGLLYNLNTPLIRLYEGYPWRRTWLGRRRIEHYRRIVDALQARREGIPHVAGLLKDEGAPSTPTGRTLGEARRLASERIFLEFPNRGSVLPTRLGNVIRSFENYPQRQYSIASIPMWPRLQTVISKEYATLVDEAKASFDFMLNSATLSGVLALGIAATVLAFPEGTARGGSFAVAVAQIGAVALCARWFYVQAVGRAQAWGEMVKGSFDLFRWDLLAKLGYQQVPRTPVEERRLWSAVSTWLSYGDPPADVGAQLPAYASIDSPAPGTAASEPPMSLEVLCGVGKARTDGDVLVRVQITNRSAGQTAELVRYRAEIPEGFDYRWGSATSTAAGLVVRGVSRLEFEVRQALAPGDSIQLQYLLAARVGPVNGDGSSPARLHVPQANRPS